MLSIKFCKPCRQISGAGALELAYRCAQHLRVLLIYQVGQTHASRLWHRHNHRCSSVRAWKEFESLYLFAAAQRLGNSSALIENTIAASNKHVQTVHAEVLLTCKLTPTVIRFAAWFWMNHDQSWVLPVLLECHSNALFDMKLLKRILVNRLEHYVV